ncbi:hypothetical protein A2U01_0008602, partial [Trifolium medium]|nr:hypothetical protein [Trifolium medium]
MLRTAEKNMNKGKGKASLMVNNRKFKKPNKWMGKGKGKEVVKPKPTTHALKPKCDIAKEGNCFHCGKTVRKRKCSKYLEDKKNGIESFNSTGFARSRELAKGGVDLRVGNGANVVALA